jgi:tRNA threonylcarbamoyladenosine biosynthesis protein TsaB
MRVTMRVLAFDTSLGGGSVAVTDGDRLLAAVAEPQPRALVERLLPMIEQALAAAGLSYAALDRIGVTVGPGTFAGLRIGVAAARGLAVATGVPAVGVTSLEALAHGVRAEVDPDETLIAAIDGRRGQLYLQAFRLAAGGAAALAPPAAVDLADLPARFPPGPGAIVGSGAVAALAAAPPGYRAVARTTIDAADVAALAAALPLPAHPPRPLYLRAPDARLPGAAA